MSLAIRLEEDLKEAGGGPYFYVAGQELQGVARYMPTKSEKLTGIYLKWQAYEQVDHAVSEKVRRANPVFDRMGSPLQYEKGGRRYVFHSEVKTLWGNAHGVSGSNASATPFPVSSQEYPFSFVVPEGPPSLSTKKGKVKVCYRLKMFVKELSSFHKLKTKCKLERRVIVENQKDLPPTAFHPLPPSRVSFGNLDADVELLRGVTWEDDNFVFNMTFRTMARTQTHRFKTRIVQHLEAGSYKKDIEVMRIAASFVIKPMETKIFFGLGKKKNPIYPRAVTFIVPELPASCSGVLISVSYDLIVESHGTSATFPLTVLGLNSLDLKPVQSEYATMETTVELAHLRPAPSIPLGTPLHSHSGSAPPLPVGAPIPSNVPYGTPISSATSPPSHSHSHIATGTPLVTGTPLPNSSSTFSSQPNNYTPASNHSLFPPPSTSTYSSLPTRTSSTSASSPFPYQPASTSSQSSQVRHDSSRVTTPTDYHSLFPYNPSTPAPASAHSSAHHHARTRVNSLPPSGATHSFAPPLPPRPSSTNPVQPPALPPHPHTTASASTNPSQASAGGYPPNYSPTPSRPSLPPPSLRSSNMKTVLFDFDAQQDWELRLVKGDVVEVLETDGEWLRGSCQGREGFFPKAFVSE